MESDRIFLFDEGRIAAQGTHGELAAGNELYKDLFHEMNAHIGIT
jgi:ABC-type multidrug transport system fused ATPase/permease subunit